ncbi:unnamed protein product [Prunus armeniaca]|uniref:Uncharacterized protein n=1 Tax=Prunus armeniaca TaxID=36596 RepID=A0A6J5XYF1_PRUAR|nr:unnamed protein product [Prunus armeniaca]CAB4318231.1 unnamed protein product [Prunus armeniaca]
MWVMERRLVVGSLVGSDFASILDVEALEAGPGPAGCHPRTDMYSQVRMQLADKMGYFGTKTTGNT